MSSTGYQSESQNAYVVELEGNDIPNIQQRSSRRIAVIFAVVLAIAGVSAATLRTSSVTEVAFKEEEDGVSPKPKHNSMTNHHKQIHHRQNTKNNKKDESAIHDDDANLAYNGKNGWPGNKNGDDASEAVDRGVPPMNVTGPSTDAPPTEELIEDADPKPKHNSMTNHHKQTHHRQNTKNNKKDEDNIHDDDANLAYNGKNGWPGNKNGDDESEAINRGIPPLNVSGPDTNAPDDSSPSMEALVEDTDDELKNEEIEDDYILDVEDPKPKHNSMTNHHKQTHHRQNTKNNKKDEDNIHDDDANLAYNGKNGWPGNKNGDDASEAVDRGVPPMNVTGPSTDAPPTN